MATNLQRLTAHVSALFNIATVPTETLMDYATAICARNGTHEKLASLTDPEKQAQLVLFHLQTDAMQYVRENERRKLQAQVDAAIDAKYPQPVPPASIL